MRGFMLSLVFTKSTIDFFLLQLQVCFGIESKEFE